jgi:molybdenum cofactor cytidylyltransferase
LDWACEAALQSEASQVIVVFNPTGGVKRITKIPAVEVVVNPDSESGMASSIQCGLAHVAPHLERAVIALGDQPLVTAAHLNSLASSLGLYDMAATRYPQGVLGVPAAFRRNLFAELNKLTGDQGARALIARSAGKISQVPFDKILDIDTPSDLEEANAFNR